MKKSTIQNTVLVITSVCLTLLVLELVVRIHHGRVFELKPLTTAPRNRVERMEYHSRLGWIPKPGRFNSYWTARVNVSGLRSNGNAISTNGRPILAVGDSFTFGDEVEDDETWVARLEVILNKPVLNAGVGAYGIDQAVLRAELLLDEHQPDVVILSFISDDISRTEFSNYPYAYGQGWKPYFEFANGLLRLRNVPVPQQPTARCCQTLRRALSYSFLANAVLSRTARQWWKNLPVIERIHNEGENISVGLLAHLDSLMKDRNSEFIAIALAANGRIGNNARLPNVVKRAREKGIQVLDLSTETLKIEPEKLQNLFRSGGHYSPEMNSWVAEHVAAFLREEGIVKRVP